MGVLRSRDGTWALSQWDALLFMALIKFQSCVAPAEPPIIFIYEESLPEFLAVVPGNPSAAINKISNEDIVCLGKGFTSFGDQPYGAASSGKCLYKPPVQLIKPCACSQLHSVVTSFSTLFQIGLLNYNSSFTAPGMAFVIGNDNSYLGEGGGYLGWLNYSTNDVHNFAVELDLIQDVEFSDPPAIHVGVDKHSLTSVHTMPLLANDFSSNEFILTVWIEYDGSNQTLDVYISPDMSSSSLDNFGPLFGVSKPKNPNISTFVDLTETFSPDGMFVGFSAGFPDSSYAGFDYWIYHWTFNSDGLAPDVARNADGSPSLTEPSAQNRLATNFAILMASMVPSLLIFLALLFIIRALYRRNARLTALAKRYKMEIDVLDEGPRNFKYRVQSMATKGFSSTELLGSGGFGSVYKGSLVLKGGKSPTEIAVKRISDNSNQGAQEFLAEIKIISQVQHRNLVRLLGWCHEREELLLVYDYMPNGSVDHHLYKLSPGEPVLTWARRLKILSGVATALAYLHEEWEQRVVHRDVKSSNVMLDSDFNARLGDFGLARLSNHDQAPATTDVLAGTYGYLAPELAQTLKPTEKTDVYSFGAMVLEVATGKTPLQCYRPGNVTALPI